MNREMAAELAAIEAIVEEHRAVPGALLPILHAIQDRTGHIPPAAIPRIAAALSLSSAEVQGVISYYPHFRQAPGGRHHVQICRAEACQAMGADALAAHARTALDCGFHETTADGAFTLEPVHCLGMCACAPAIAIDDEPEVRVSADKFNRLIKAARDAR